MSAVSRTLLIRERVVEATEREGYLATLRDTRERCAEHGVQFWAFVHEHDAGRFVEFAEAKQPELLGAAGVPTEAPASVWRSIELG